MNNSKIPLYINVKKAPKYRDKDYIYIPNVAQERVFNLTGKAFNLGSHLMLRFFGERKEIIKADYKKILNRTCITTVKTIKSGIKKVQEQELILVYIDGKDIYFLPNTENGQKNLKLLETGQALIEKEKIKILSPTW